MQKKSKSKEPTYTNLSLLDSFETPLVVIALEHEITRARQFARVCKDTKKKLFHETVERTYQEIVDVINSVAFEDKPKRKTKPRAKTNLNEANHE